MNGKQNARGGKMADFFMKHRDIFISTGLWGILAHGMAFFNKYSFHDDAGLFSVGATYSFGRWMLGILDEGIKKLTGSPHYSMPLFNGIVTVCFIALSCVLVSEILDIKSGLLRILLTGGMTVFPMVAGVFGYIFTAPYYFFGTFMGVSGVWLFSRPARWYHYLAGIVLMACSTGVYQANIPVCVSLFLVYMIKETSGTMRTEWKKLLRCYVSCVSGSIGFLIAYLAVNKFFLSLKGIQLTDYNGINGFGRTSWRGYLWRIRLAYTEFIKPTEGIRNMYPFSLDKLYGLMIVAAIIMTLYLIYRKQKESLFLGGLFLGLVIFIPLAVNFIYVMCDASSIHSLMMYGEVFFFVYFVWVSDCVKRQGVPLGNVTANAAAVVAFIMCLGYCRFDNAYYLKAEFLQEQTISYYTTLITRIKSTGGYTDDTKVVYINEYQKTDVSLPDIPEFDEINILPYNSSNWINDYLWKESMRMWCGFAPQTEESSGYAELPEVVGMPCYPDEGSIKMINGVLVVKF